jgi:arylsulfatase A-like enzyme
VIQLDLLPTFLAAAGGEVSPDWKLDGVNLLPYLTGDNLARPHETLYWRFGKQMAIRHGDWKLVTGEGITEPALFNLAADIGEQHDLTAAEPATARKLQSLWDAWNAEQIPPRWPPNKPQEAPAAATPAAGS